MFALVKRVKSVYRLENGLMISIGGKGAYTARGFVLPGHTNPSCSCHCPEEEGVGFGSDQRRSKKREPVVSEGH